MAHHWAETTAESKADLKDDHSAVMTAEWRVEQKAGVRARTWVATRVDERAEHWVEPKAFHLAERMECKWAVC